jgi:predicted phosphodiesterase
LFVNSANGIGISGQYQGALTPGQWHRIVFTVDCTRRELGKYIDGTNVLSGPVGVPPLGTNSVQYLDPVEGAADGRWSLGDSALLFADDNSETGAGYVNSIQMQDRVLTPAQVSALGGPSPSGIPPIIPATIAQWDFNGSLASSTGGSNLVAASALPAGSPGFAFTSTSIGGELAQVMSFTRGTFFRAAHRFAANGGGGFVNSYTLIMDVMFPNRPTGWAALWQTSTANNNDGDWFVNPAAGVGISGNYGGTVADGSWNRLALVIDSASGTLTSFINGQQVQQIGGIVVDGRWSLAEQGLLFADEDQENAAGFVNSVQIRNSALTPSELADLGGPSAAGIPAPSTPILRILAPNGGEVYQAGTTQKVTWIATSASGGLQVDLLRGGELYRSLGQVAMRDSNFVWAISPRLGDSNNYQIRLSSLSFPSVQDASDQPFTVFGSASPSSPSFGEPLQSNGGFEQQLANWQTVIGHPTTLTSTNGKGAPHNGTRFFHGGLNPAGDAIIRQEIDLLAAGFTAFDVDSGAALDAEAWLSNRYGANTFDDQVFYRVAYLTGAGDELSSLRCMVAGNNVWLRKILIGLLPPGTRRLSLEVVGRHRRDLDNDSMADDLLVKLQEAVPASPIITKLPMLQDVRTNAMTLFWETDGNLCSHVVQWGRSNVNEQTLTRVETLQIDGTHFVHRATLTGLETETSYSYRVQSGATTSPTFTFRTAPRNETPFAAAWWGDNHQGTVTLRTHVANMLAHGPDLICVAGDMVNSGDLLDEWHNYWFKPLEHLQLAQTHPVIYARGNHDGEHALAYAYSALPGNEAWFAFDYGNTRFIFLDSETATSSSPEQFAWLQAELSRPETQRAAFRVVCFHRPPYVNLWNGGGHTGEGWVQTDWVPLFEEKNVDLVISGHAHNYNRGMQRGVTYVVSGGGGGTLDVQRVANWPLYTVEYSRYHFDLMEVVGETLSWQTFDEQNQLLDSFTLKSRRGSMEWGSAPPTSGPRPLVLSGKPGTTYVVERSANLQAWTPYATNVLTASGSGFATNLITTTNSYFFRSRAP